MKKGVYETIMKRRSTRRFRQLPISPKILNKLVNAARVAPSAGNLQPLEYIVVNDKRVLPEVFRTLKWARYIAPKGTPPEGEKPVAYIAVLVNEKIRDLRYAKDIGAAVENILLTALEEGIGGCCIDTIDKKKLRKILNVPDFLAIESVIALGYAAESPVAEKMTKSVKYWKDRSGTLHVPKRELKNILHRNRYGA